MTAPFARTQRKSTWPRVAPSLCAGGTRAAVTGPAGSWVIGLSDAVKEKRGERERKKEKHALQRTVRFDDDAMLPTKVQGGPAVLIDVRVQVYLMARVISSRGRQERERGFGLG